MRLPLIFLATVALSDGARILALFPHNGKSHQMVFEPLLRTLAKRGHHLTVVTFFPLENPPANYTEVSLQGIADPGLETIDLIGFEDSSWMSTILKSVGNPLSQLRDFQMIAEIAVSVCEKAVDWPALTAALKKEYDVVIMESFNTDCMLGLLDVYKVKAPVVALLSCSPMPWTVPRFGLTDNPSYVPLISLPHTTEMTFAQRIKNTILNVFYRYFHKYAIQIKEQAILERRFGGKISQLEDLAKNMSMLLVNIYHPLNGVRPLLPAVAEVGGMHLEAARKPIPRVSRHINKILFHILSH